MKLVPPSIISEVSTTPTRSGAGGKGQARPAGCEAKREPLPGHGSVCGQLSATNLDQLKDGGGDIMNISSVAGRTARAGNGVYR
jgi:hypothetical protein